MWLFQWYKEENTLFVGSALMLYEEEALPILCTSRCVHKAHSHNRSLYFSYYCTELIGDLERPFKLHYGKLRVILLINLITTNAMAKLSSWSLKNI
jgi:hypothetical protein